MVAEGPGDQLQKASAAAESPRRRFADGPATGWQTAAADPRACWSTETVKAHPS